MCPNSRIAMKNKPSKGFQLVIVKQASIYDIRWLVLRLQIHDLWEACIFKFISQIKVK